MPAVLTIRDETLSGETLHEWCLEFLSETIDVRELIRSRVYQEVQDYNVKRSDYRGLVKPEAWEERLNGISGPFKPIDWKLQFEVACEAFEHNRILILVNERQLDSLDETVVVTADTRVSFLRLTPFVGG